MLLVLGLLIDTVAVFCLVLAAVGASNRHVEDARIVALIGIGLAIVGSGLINA